MLKRGLKAHEFFEQVVLTRVNDLGITAALKHNNVIVLYSGPDIEIIKRLGADAVPNWKLAADQITRLGASIINTTDIAEFLEAIDLKKYFEEVYSDKDDVDDAWLEVWGKTSALFAECDFEEAATAVCGASKKRVFRAYEQDALLRNKHVKIINGRSIDLFNDFGKLGSYEAFRLICITEILEIRKHARDVNTPKAWQDYRQRRNAFLIQFADISKAAAPMPEIDRLELKQHKREILALHNVSAIKSSITSITSTTVSVSGRPADPIITVPARHVVAH